MSKAANDRRTKGRLPMGTVLPITLSLKDSDLPLGSQLYDVSDTGIGVIIDRLLAPGTKVVLRTLQRRITFETAWCVQAGANEFHCGLELEDASINLDEIFSQLVVASAS